MPQTATSHIDWTELYLPGEKYRESYVEESAFAERFAEIKWTDRLQFIEDMLGSSRKVGNGINRTLPEVHPDKPNLFASEVVSVNYYGNVAPDSSKTTPGLGWQKADTICYRIVYRPKLYRVMTDSAIGTPQTLANGGKSAPELKRFVVKQRKHTFENQQAAALLYYEGGASAGQPVPPPACPAKALGLINLIYTWMKVPIASVPWGIINQYAYSINSDIFDPDDTINGNFAAESIAFLGADEVNFVDTSRASIANQGLDDILTNVIFYLSSKEESWNKFPDPAFQMVYLNSVQGGVDPTKRVYQANDLNNLFRPNP